MGVKKLYIMILSTILLAGCSKKTEIIDSNCACSLKFNDSWSEVVYTTEYETDDGEKLEKDYRIIGDVKTCLTMWNKEKKMSLVISEFTDENTMKLDEDEIIKIIRQNLELEYEFLGYVVMEQSEYKFLGNDFYIFVAERSVNGDYQVDLIEIEENNCNIIGISGQKIEDIFKELDILEKNQK